MKTIYTSNYARIKQFTKEVPDAHIVATSCWIARWHKGAIHEQRMDIAPTWDIVRPINEGKITWEEYETAYLKLLEDRKVDAQKVIDELPNNTFLLCFEAPDDLCHRHSLARWVKLKTGFVIPEWKSPKERFKAAKDGSVESLLDL